MKTRTLLLPLFFVFVMLALSACLPSDPYTLRAAADSLIEGTHVAQTETAEAVVRENQAAVLEQMQTQQSSDNMATATAQVMYANATATALEHDAQATQAAATAAAIATQEAQLANATRQAVELAQLQAGATATQQAVRNAASAEAAKLVREKVITVLLWLAVVIALGLFIFLAYEFARMFTRTLGKQRAWVAGAESFYLDSDAGPVLVQPRKMFGPGMQVAQRTGEMTMPQLAAPDAQMYTTLAALAVELQREVSKRAQWLTPLAKNGMGEAFAPMVDNAPVPQLPMPQLAPLPMLSGRHILIAGPTGGGKSHTARYLLQARRNVYVLDPHFAPGEWTDHCRVIGGGRNFRAIAETIHQVYELMDGRFKQRNAGNALFSAVHLVTDELPAIVKSEPKTADELMQIGREGRKVNVFLMLLTQSVMVKTLGIEGEGDARKNFATIMLDQLPEGQPEDTPRKCTVIIGDFKNPESKAEYLIPATIPTGNAVPGAGNGVPGPVLGVPEGVPNVPRLLEMGAGTGSQASGTAFPGAGTGFSGGGTPPEPGTPEEIALIRQLAGQGFGVDRIANLLGGRRVLTLERVRAVLGRIEEVEEDEKES